MEKEFVILVGPQGSGKTTLCAQKFPDHLRISKDDQGEKHLHILNEALVKGTEKIILDRTNGVRNSRAKYLHFATRNGYRTKIVWVNEPYETCLARIKARKRHPTLAKENAEVALDWYFKHFRTPSPLEADELEILGNAHKFVEIKDICDELSGKRYLIVGDIHGCYDELLGILDEREFDLQDDVLITVGDLVDRGPDSKAVIEFCTSLPHFYSTCGNHDERLVKYLFGDKVKMDYGIDETIASYGGTVPKDLIPFIKGMPFILKIPAGYIVHAGFDPLLPIERQSKRDCLYMRYYGGEGYFDKDGGEYWFKSWPKDSPKIFFGHEPNPKGYIPDNIVPLDGGCCFGEYLKAYDSRDGMVHYFNAAKRYCEDERK
jgi:Calcineurin-like phosphoesterase/AAA domain